MVLLVEEKWIIVYYEGGYVLLVIVLVNVDLVYKVMILFIGMVFGVIQMFFEEWYSYSQVYIEDVICMMLGGCIVEELVFIQCMIGVFNDLEKVISLVKWMVREWGMSDWIGLMVWEFRGQVFFGEDLMIFGREYLEDIVCFIDEEVLNVLRGQEEWVRELICKYRKGFDLVVDVFFEKEIVDGVEVVRLVQQGFIMLVSNGFGFYGVLLLVEYIDKQLLFC